ncbi:MAG: bifunctional pyr operon transcriptional regulator/uracil phosphoribosyltransferase PyrR [Acidobacteria bacterium]|nr:bifunctional pyr operon transcriptional regulator/uracil phosphoribosyltransferase PyrR [Acidobacteriota bacterium]
MAKNYVRQIMTGKEMDLALSRIAAEIIEAHQDLGDTVLVGIRRRGVPLAEKLVKKIEKLSGKRLPLGVLDITFYRDDLSMVDNQPVVEGSHLDFDVAGKSVLLVDDVLFTGRTTRAALDNLVDYGRPRKVELVVLIDRGHRELPIQADYVGKYVETAVNEVVEVRVSAVDEEEAVYLSTRELIGKRISAEQ